MTIQTLIQTFFASSPCTYTVIQNGTRYTINHLNITIMLRTIIPLGKKFEKTFYMVLLTLFSTTQICAQTALCDTNTQAGDNLIVNGGFEDGDIHFTLPDYYSWNASGNQPWSKPNQYWVHDDANDFNKSFLGVPQSGDKFLMVDGDCELGDVVWEQYVTVTAGQRYFFSTGITSIRIGSPAELTFQINGQNLAQPIQAPSSPGSWVTFVDSSWLSTVTGSVPIRIINQQINGCSSGNDFGLDNVAFAPGCAFGDPGEIPALGPDLTLCEGQPNLTLSTPVLGGSNNYRYRWSTGDSTESIDISTPGTYSVCLSTNGSCEEADEITILESTLTELISDATSNCQGDTVNFSTQSTGPNTPTQIDWYIDDILTLSNSPNFEHQFVQSSEIKMIATIDPNNCHPEGVVRDSLLLDVQAPEVPTITLTSDTTTICPGTNVNLASNASHTTNPNWYLNDISLPGNDTINTVTIDTTSWISISAAFDNLLCHPDVTLRDSILVTVLTFPETSVTISSDNNTLCEHDNPVQLSVENLVNADPNATFEWFKNDLSIANSDAHTIEQEAADGDSFAFVVTHSNVCASNLKDTSNTVVISVIPTVNAQISLSLEKTSFCKGEPVNIEANSTQTGSYEWFINGQPQNNPNSIFSPSTSDHGDSISVLFTTIENCALQTEASDFVLISIDELSFDLTNLDPDADCLGDTITFQATQLTNTGTSPQFQWYINGLITSNTTDSYQSASWNSGDSVSLVVSSALAGCNDSDTAFGLISDLAIPFSGQVFLDDQEWCASSEYIYDYTANTSLQATYQWTLDGNPVSIDQEPFVFTDQLQTNHTLIVEIFDNGECVANTYLSDTANLTINSTSVVEAGEDMTITAEEPFLLGGYSPGSTPAVWSTSSDLVAIIDPSDLESSVEFTSTVDPSSFFLTDAKSVTLSGTDQDDVTDITFFLTAQNGNCPSIDSLTVTVEKAVHGIFPNAFSPNGDGDNDQFEIDHLNYFPGFELNIYNRWGSLVFTQTEPNSFWDGTREGVEMPMATYYYIFKTGQKETSELKGALTLMR